MASSLFPKHSKPQNTNPMASAVSQVRQMANGNPQALFNQLMQTNPRFKQFVDNNQGKSPQQIAQENGIDFNQLRSFMNQ